MMNKRIVLSLLLLPALAWAAPSQSSTKTWSGFYGGGHIGGVFNDASVDSANLSFSNIEGVCNLKKNFSSLFLGGQAGVVKQLQSNLVLGVEGNYSYHFNQYVQAQCDCEFEPSDNEPPTYDAFNIVNREQASIRGRLGYAMPLNILPYATAGVSFANLGMDYSNEGGNTHSSLSFQPGWLVGGGVEWAYTPQWTVRLEYYYARYDELQMPIYDVYGIEDANGHGNLNISTNNIRAALSYWF